MLINKGVNMANAITLDNLRVWQMARVTKLTSSESALRRRIMDMAIPPEPTTRA